MNNLIIAKALRTQMNSIRDLLTETFWDDEMIIKKVKECQETRKEWDRVYAELTQEEKEQL